MEHGYNRYYLMISCTEETSHYIPEVRSLVSELNDTLGQSNKLLITCVDWKHNVFPSDSSLSAQDSIDQQILTPSDGLIAILGNRFGSSVKHCQSGVEYEMQKASQDGKDVLLLFDESAPTPKTNAAAKQLARVAKFKDTYAQFRYDFNNAEEFRLQLRKWIIKIIFNKGKQTPHCNVFCSSRKNIELAYSLDMRLGSLENDTTDISEIRILNFAATSIVAADYVTPDMKNPMHLHIAHLMHLGICLELIITAPDTFAARDASIKMSNMHFLDDQSKVIRMTYHQALELIRSNPAYAAAYHDDPPRFRFLTTDIALPYAIMQVIHKPDFSYKDYIKVDLYSPYLDNDNNRRSFIVWAAQDNENYTFFEDSYRKIRKYSKNIRIGEDVTHA